MGLVTLPTELLVQILGYLETKDLKTLSLCSRRHRDVALPELLRNVRLSEESAGLFDGGSLSDYKGVVCHVRLTGLRARPPAEVLARTRFYIRQMHLFPNVNSMHMSFLAGRELDFGNALIVAMFTRLSKLPMYKNLRRVIIKTQYNLDETRGDCIESEEEDAGDWTPELQDAMMGGYGEVIGRIDGRARPEFVRPEYPPNLEEVVMQTDRWHPIFGSESETGGVHNASTMLFVSSANTLKSLQIIGMRGFGRRPSWKERRPGELPVFTALRELWIDRPPQVGVDVWEDLVEMFPSVEDLTVDTGFQGWEDETTGAPLLYHRPYGIAQPQVPYGQLVGMTRLRRARLKWPADMGIGRAFTHGQLEGVMGWLRENGCSELKEIGWLGHGQMTKRSDELSRCRWESKGVFGWELVCRARAGEAASNIPRAQEYYTVGPDAEEGIYDVLAD